MQSRLEVSPYLESYVMADPGTVSSASSSLTGITLLWFRPKFGLDAGTEVCVAAGTAEEILAFRASLEEKRQTYRKTDKHKKYLEIEGLFAEFNDSERPRAAVLAALEALKSHMSEVQKERNIRLRKR